MAAKSCQISQAGSIILANTDDWLKMLLSDHTLHSLREFFLSKHILICFNGPASRPLISEIGDALKLHIGSSQDREALAMDVFSVYIEMSQNIRHYAAERGYVDSYAAATVVISESPEGQIDVMAGNVVEHSDGLALIERVATLSGMTKPDLKDMYKQQLRVPRENGKLHRAGLGLIAMARCSSAPISCCLNPLESGKHFLTIKVTIG